MSQPTFLNRQALYLRPDPSRVIVRPFKPATEPRDLNPTDKTRANHIVDRVLALDAAAVALQLADVLENFEGRHRNLLETFEARADEMEQAFAKHGDFSYGLYIVHWPILQVFIALGATRFSPAVFFLMSTSTIVLTSVLMWKLVESKFLARNNHYRDPSAQTPA